MPRPLSSNTLSTMVADAPELTLIPADVAPVIVLPRTTASVPVSGIPHPVSAIWMAVWAPVMMLSTTVG